MRRHRPLLLGSVLVLVLALGLGVWLLWPRSVAGPPAPAEPALPAAPTRGGPGASFRSARGAVAPTAVLAPGPRAPGPCVRGHVRDAATSSGIPGAQVVLATARGALEARTDAAGAFELSPPEGDGAIGLAEVSAEGYLPYRPAWGHSPVTLTLTAGVCVSDLVLTLSPRLLYRGLVEDPNGAPISGALVTVASPDEPPGPAITTDADGAFTFSAPEGAVVVASHARFAPAHAEVDFRVSVTRQLLLTLSPLSQTAPPARTTVTGVVVDAFDAGLGGARVSARAASSAAGERLEGVTESDAAGRFWLDLEARGPWTLRAQLPGMLSLPATTAGEPVVLRLLGGAELRGLVTDGRGRAVQSFSVMVSRRLGPLQLDREETRHVVDPGGRFALQGLPPGPAQVVVAALGYAASEPVDVELVAGVPREVRVSLREGGSVTGRVVDRASRAALPGARVSLEGGGDGAAAVMPLAHADADGGFLLSGVAPGRRSIFVTAEAHHARLLSVEAREGEVTGPLLIDLGVIASGDSPRLELVGIGAVLSASADALLVGEVMPGGGAAEAGLSAGDGILAIDGEPVERLGFGGGVERIRGPEGTFVRLSVRLRDGSVVERNTPRRRIEHP